MMRLIVILLLLLFVAAGVAVGALNADLVGFDLLFTQVNVPKGAAMLAMLALGWILGGLTAWLGMTMRLRKARQVLPHGQGSQTTNLP